MAYISIIETLFEQFSLHVEYATVQEDGNGMFIWTRLMVKCLYWIGGTKLGKIELRYTKPHLGTIINPSFALFSVQVNT